jgi:hypothetical protein
MPITINTLDKIKSLLMDMSKDTCLEVGDACVCVSACMCVYVCVHVYECASVCLCQNLIPCALAPVCKLSNFPPANILLQ